MEVVLVMQSALKAPKIRRTLYFADRRIRSHKNEEKLLHQTITVVNNSPVAKFQSPCAFLAHAYVYIYSPQLVLYQNMY